MTNKKEKCLECNESLISKKKQEIYQCSNKKCNKTYLFSEFKNLENLKRIQTVLDNELQRLIQDEKFIQTEPSKTFSIGEVVHSTYGQNYKIVNQIDNRFYCVVNEQNNKKWVRYHELYKIELEKAPVVFNNRSERLDKRVQFSNRRLDGVIHYYYNGRLNMNPEYQRGFVWQNEHKVKLIDSIFNGYDIGKMVFVRLPYEPNNYMYEILDGKQRLSTIIEFIEDRFTYNGYVFSQLQDRDKQEFLSSIVAIGETDEGFTLNDRMKYFLSVNDTGVPQDASLLEQIKKKISTL